VSVSHSLGVGPDLGMSYRMVLMEYSNCDGI
jgi:hypothetical protein